ncbi:MAG: hypothetical protein Q9170_005668 [Blastenia crenularia]
MKVNPRIILGILDRHDPTLSWGNIARSSTSYLLLGTCLLWTLSYQYCRFASSRDPTSYFFDPHYGYERRYSLHREQQAYDFITAANNTTPTTITNDPERLICLGIATVARPTAQQYVRGTIGSLLQGLSADERRSIYFMPFIAHTNPADHPIRQEPWLTTVSDRVLEYEVDDGDLMKLRQFEEGHHFRNKSMYDYGYLLENCFQTGAPWVAIIEDDVLARAGWYPEAQIALSELKNRATDNRWLYLRMFYTEGLLGWNSEEWVRYLGWSFIIFLSVLVILLSIRTRSMRLYKSLSNLNVAITSLVCVPAFIILYFLAGRMTVLPPTAGVHDMNRFGCCSQGFIFPRAIVPALVERTKKAMDEDYYVDMLLERWADAERLDRFVLVPSLLQHVGAKSSKGWGYDESAGPYKLRIQHEWTFDFKIPERCDSSALQRLTAINYGNTNFTKTLLWMFDYHENQPFPPSYTFTSRHMMRDGVDALVRYELEAALVPLSTFQDGLQLKKGLTFLTYRDEGHPDTKILFDCEVFSVQSRYFSPAYEDREPHLKEKMKASLLSSHDLPKVQFLPKILRPTVAVIGRTFLLIIGVNYDDDHPTTEALPPVFLRKVIVILIAITENAIHIDE